MENKKGNLLNNESSVTLRFSQEAEKECYIGIRGQLIKLLYLIEAEQKGEGSAELFFFSFITELIADNDLCHQKLTRVVGKVYGLYKDEKYKSMTHDQIKRLIFEARGIVDHLIDDVK